MTYSYLTNRYRPSQQRSSRNGTTIDSAGYHHLASTSAEAAAQAMIRGTKLVSCNYLITNEGEAWNIVDEGDRAWTSGSSKDGGRGAAWDRRSLTFEIEDETAGPEWRISDAAVEKTASIVNDAATRHPIVNEWAHYELWEDFRASYPTYCPGRKTKARIQAARGSLVLPDPITIPVPPPTPTVPAGWEWVLPSKKVQEDIQRGLFLRNRYYGRVDGDWGRLSIAAIQLTLQNVGYSGLLDGIPGKMTCYYVQVYAKKFGGYNGPLDSELGPNSWAGFRAGLLAGL